MKDFKVYAIALGCILIALAAVLTSTSWSAMTNSYPDGRPNAYALTGGPGDQIMDWADEVEDILEGTQAVPGIKRTVEIFDANDTLTAAETGKVCVSQGHSTAAANVIFTLPAAAVGLQFTFVDANATAADDVWITAGTGDKINGGTAAKSYKCVTDAVGQSVTLLAVDATNWELVAETGTWANDNN